MSDLSKGSEIWAIAWPSLYEFYRLVTHPKIFKEPSSRRKVYQVIESLFEIPSLRILSHGLSHFTHSQILADESDATGNIAFDVQIAAIFKEHGVATLLTNDADFRRFRSLRVINPFE